MSPSPLSLVTTGIASYQAVLPSFDLTNVRHRVMKEHPDWTPERLETAIHDYREFFALSKAMKGYNLVPTHDADEVWHAHILHTRDYMRCCMEFAGFILHHSPKLPGEDSRHDDKKTETARLYEAFFGKPHPVIAGARDCSSSCTVNEVSPNLLN